MLFEWLQANSTKFLYLNISKVSEVTYNHGGSKILTSTKKNTSSDLLLTSGNKRTQNACTTFNKMWPTFFGGAEIIPKQKFPKAQQTISTKQPQPSRWINEETLKA